MSRNKGKDYEWIGLKAGVFSIELDERTVQGSNVEWLK